MKWMLKKYMAQQHIDSFTELARRIGMTRKTFYERLENPRTMRIYELEALNKILKLSDEDLMALAKGKI